MLDLGCCALPYLYTYTRVVHTKLRVNKKYHARPFWNIEIRITPRVRETEQ